MELKINLENEANVTYLVNYANEKNVSLDYLFERLIGRAVEKIQEMKLEKQEKKKVDAVFINDYLKTKLKFKYGISRLGDVICFQQGKEKKINICTDSENNYFIYLLKQGCPSRCDAKTLSAYSVKINLEELYDHIWGEGTFNKNASQNVANKVIISQNNWKKRSKKK